MRPHIRSSTEYRRRSVASSSDLSKHELLRRKSLTTTGASPPSLSSNSDSVSRQPYVSRSNTNSFFLPADRISEMSTEIGSNAGPGTSLLNQRRESLTGEAGGRRFSLTHGGIQRRESAPVFGGLNSRSRMTRASSLDPNSYDVNSRRIVFFSVFCIVLFIILGVMTWFYKYSKSPVWV